MSGNPTSMISGIGSSKGKRLPGQAFLQVAPYLDGLLPDSP